MFTSMNLAINALYVFVALNLIFIMILYGIKIWNVRQHRIYEHFNYKYKDYLMYIQANLESDERLRVPPVRMNAIESHALQDRLNDMIEYLTDEQRYKLIELCEQLGFIQTHLRRLHNRSYKGKVDAAYHLGCMRVKEAVPALLEVLRLHKFDSTLFVIARAIAKCSQDEEDVKEMIRILLTHNINFPDLIADMIEEAQIDQTALFTKCIQEDQSALIDIGLTGLKEYTNPSIAVAVRQLTESTNEEIQRKAIEVYLKSSMILPKHVVSIWLEHPNAEIRLMTIQALSVLKNMSYAGQMEKGLMDRDRRVVYASAMGLIYLGQEGISIFCEAARDSWDQGHGEAIQEIIEEELKHLSTRLHNIDNLTRHNALMYTYEKTNGQNKRIYRVV